MQNSTYVHGLAYSTGVIKRVDALGTVARDDELRQLMARNGMEFYSDAEGGPTVLAERAMREALDKSGVPPARVDAVVYATSSFSQREYYTSEYALMAHRVGVGNADSFGVCLNDCANVATAFWLARSLLAGGSQNVLVVTTDVFEDEVARLRNQLLTINSDGAGACVVNRNPSPVRLLDVAQVTRQETWLASAMQERFLTILRGVKIAADRLLERLELSGQQIDILLTNNYHKHAGNMLAFQSGVPAERLHRGRVSEVGHLSGTDCLANLRDVVAAGSDRTLTAMSLATGVSSWGALAWELSSAEGAS